jgi:hypothetical protein
MTDSLLSLIVVTLLKKEMLHQSELLREALEKANVPATLHTVVGGGHEDFKQAEVLKLCVGFLSKHLV